MQTLIEVKPGLKFQVSALKSVLPTVELVLFFAKLYKLDGAQLAALLLAVHNTTVAEALLGEGGQHSNELQDYLVELGYESDIQRGDIILSDAKPKGEILPEVWKSLEITVAAAIQEVADKIGDVVGHLPGKQGTMVFQHLMQMNAKRPVIGDYKARINHKPAPSNLVIFDVSGSMSEPLVKTLVDDVVAMGYMADAYLAIVSNHTTWWEPGEYSVESILAAAEFAGTHYETLHELMEREWGVVVTVADYDSAPSAKSAIARCSGKIEQVLDISLVSKPTFLSEVVGQLAKEVKPLLVAADDRCCMGY